MAYRHLRFCSKALPDSIGLPLRAGARGLNPAAYRLNSDFLQDLHRFSARLLQRNRPMLHYTVLPRPAKTAAAASSVFRIVISNSKRRNKNA